jgi:hypothetical protein
MVSSAIEAWLDLVRKRKREKLGTKVRGEMTSTVRDARESVLEREEREGINKDKIYFPLMNNTHY